MRLRWRAAAGASEAAAAEASEVGARTHPITGDVRSADDVEAMVSRAAAALGGLDVLVTVVGGQVAFRAGGQAARDGGGGLEPGLSSTCGTSPVSVGSITGLMAVPHQAAYSAAQVGLLSLARTVAAEYTADRIRLNVIVAGDQPLRNSRRRSRPT